VITLILDDGLNHAYIEDARPSPIVPAFTQFCITRNKLPALPGGIERPVATANAKAMHASKLHVVIFAAIIGLFCVAFLSVQAQDVQLESGNLTFLRGETAVCVKYVYDGMLIGTNNEADYIKYKVAFFNKKEPGKGEKWLAGWINDRTGRYQPSFERRLNKVLVRRTITFGSSQKDSKYTMILKTLVTEPGWAGWAFIHQESYIDAVVTFVESDKPDTTLATISIKHAPGNGYDYDPAGRIENTYAACGAGLGDFLWKKALK